MCDKTLIDIAAELKSAHAEVLADKKQAEELAREMDDWWARCNSRTSVGDWTKPTAAQND